MTVAARRRLDADVRRRQLIELGLAMLSREPREQVAVDRIAKAAGISRGLLFHYFPSKRDYHVAVVRAAADHMLEVTEPDPGIPLAERLRASLGAYIDFVAGNSALYVSLVRGAAGRDEVLQEIFDQTRARIADRITASLGVAGGTPALRTLIRGWIGFVEESTLDWLRHRDLPRDALIALQERTLLRSLDATR